MIQANSPPAVSLIANGRTTVWTQPKFLDGIRNGKAAGIARTLNRERELMEVDPAFETPGMAPNFAQYPLPHITTFQGLNTSAAKVYRTSDEAMMDSWENARYMRNDVGIMECVEARQRAVALLPWHIEPEDESDPSQVELAEKCTKIIQRISRFNEYRLNLLHGVWFGRYAIQHRYAWVNVGGREVVMPAKRRDDPGWKPVHGDKLVWRYDGGDNKYPDQMGIRVGNRYKAGAKINDKWTVEATDRGMAYFLADWERSMFAVHKHTIEDGAFEDPLQAGMIHGVGIRHRIYWEWFQKQEALAFMMEFLERSATGVEVYYYPEGNEKARIATERAATERSGNGRNMIFFPRPAGDDAMQYGLEFIGPGTEGLNSLKELLTDYFGHRIKRYILGQILSSEAQSTGLGSGVADFQYDTLQQIIRYDAGNLQETLTDDLLHPIQIWNYPSSKGIHLRFVIDVETADVEKKMEAVAKAYEIGCKISASQVTAMLGLNDPDGPEDTLQNPQIQQAAAGNMAGGFGPGANGQGGGEPLNFDPEAVAQDATQQMFGDSAEGAPGSVAYVAEGGKWQEREIPEFDTGDRVPAGKNKKEAEAGERWITIGGGENGPGTHVKVKGGKITSGPKGLTGKNLDDLGQDDASGEKPFALKRDPASKPGNTRTKQGQLFDPESIAAPDEQLPGAKLKRLGLSQTEGGRWVGAAQMNIKDIKADPERFQFKISGIGEGGVTDELRGVKQYNPELGGQMLVWHDPADGQVYVINGHHRHELASRSDQGGKWNGNVSAYFVDAETAVEARARGALANIAEGRGTALDAAKFMRDSGSTIDDLVNEGISLKGRVAQDGAILSKLAPQIFSKLTAGLVTEQRALSIAGELGDDPDLQDDLFREINAIEEKRDRELPDSVVREMAREYKETPTTTETTKSLFGDEEDRRSLMFERNTLKSEIRKMLGDERSAFKAVAGSAGEKRKGTLERGGINKIDVDQSRVELKRSEIDYDTFDRLVNYRGPISDAVNQAAQELQNGNTPRNRKRLAEGIVARIRELAAADAGTIGESAAGREEPTGSGGSRGFDESDGSDSGDDLGPRGYKPAEGSRSMFSRMARDVVRYRLTGEQARALAVDYAKKKFDPKQKSLNWITLEGGTHVALDDDGTIKKGPAALKGKTPDELGDNHEAPEDEPEGKDQADKPEDDDSGDDGPDDSPDAGPDLAGGDAAAEPLEADNPREAAAKQAEAQKRSEYEFARESKISNAGEDLKGSVRHKVNAWRGDLAEAEENGTAEKIITRDNLFKLEPPDLMSTIREGDSGPASALTALALHLCLKSFPGKPAKSGKKLKPEQEKKNREEYLNAYRRLKTKAEELARKPGIDANKAVEGFNGEVSKIIRGLREGDRFSDTANGLINLFNGTITGWGATRSGVMRKLNDFSQRLIEADGDFRGKSIEEGRETALASVDRIKSILEGKSFDAAFGVKRDESEGSKKPKFSSADLYVSHARRTGGRPVPSDSPEQTTKFMVDRLKMRGVQFGNSMTDEERSHHLTRCAEAFVDLADVLGLPIEMMSDNGKLGIAFGARGSGMAQAHYEVSEQNPVINLTRKGGVGTLAHEWGHFLDHHIGVALGADSQKRELSSQYERSRGKDWTQIPAWKQMDALKQKMQTSGYNDRLRKALGEMGMGYEKAQYFMQPAEKFARCFERFVQRKLETKGRENTYLSGITIDKALMGELWPTDDEVDAMSVNFDTLFNAIRTLKAPGKSRQEIAEANEKYRRKLRDDFNREIERYKIKPAKGQGQFEWVTIGGAAGDGGKQHVGGTPVAIDNASGKIVKGPDNLEGKSPDELSEAGAQAETPADPIEAAADEYRKHGTRSKHFKAWFGDWENDPGNASKVVDPETGEPKETGAVDGRASVVRDESGQARTVYHGTAHGGFDRFDPEKLNEGCLYGKGFYFTEDITIANEYQEKDRPYTLNRALTKKDMESARRWFHSAQVNREAREDIGTREHYGQLYKAWKAGPEAFAAIIARENDKRLMSRFGVERVAQGNAETKSVYLNIRRPCRVDESMSQLSPEDKGAIKAACIAALDRGEIQPPGTWGPGTETDKTRAAIEKVFAEYDDSAFTISDTLARLTNYTHGTKLGNRDFQNTLIRQAGFDGITHIGGSIMGGGKSHRVWIAFQPNQIKATDNQGTFDPNDEKIAYSRRLVDAANAAIAKYKIKPSKDQKSFDWITIGGAAGDGGKKHVGGTPVAVDKSSGEIVKGPDNLEGKRPDELGKGDAQAKPPKPHGADRLKDLNKAFNDAFNKAMASGTIHDGSGDEMRSAFEAKQTAMPEIEAEAADEYKRLGTKSKYFKNWFGDWEADPAGSSKVVNPETGEPQETNSISGEASKVRDKNGQAKTVYHGTTTGGYNAFEKRWGEGSHGGNPEGLLYGPGFYFTEDDGIASEYAGERGVTLAFYPSKAEAEAALKERAEEIQQRYGNTFQDIRANVQRVPGFKGNQGLPWMIQVRMFPKTEGLDRDLSPAEWRKLSDFFTQKANQAKSRGEDLQAKDFDRLGAAVDDGGPNQRRFVQAYLSNPLRAIPSAYQGVQDASREAREMLGVKPAESKHEVKQVYLNIRKPFDADSDSLTMGELRKLATDEKSVKRIESMVQHKTNYHTELAASHKEREDHNREKVERIKKQLASMPEDSGLRPTAVKVLKDAEKLLAFDVREREDHEAKAAAVREQPLKYEELVGMLGSRVAVNEALQAHGFDGITHIGGRIMGKRDHRVWIAFEPNQIKATNNRGTFDESSDRIDYARAGETDRATLRDQMNRAFNSRIRLNNP